MSINEEDRPFTKNQSTKEEQRLQAVLAVLRGRKATEVCRQYNISRSDLYKFKRRALLAMKEAVADQKRGPRTPANKTCAEKEDQIKAVCNRQPTLSSYQICRLLPQGLTTPRTVQRIRRRLRLPRLPKRDAPRRRRKRFSEEEKKFIRKFVGEKLYLGALRLSWDLKNQHSIEISASTVGRLKQSILAEINPKPALTVWRRYERRHPHSLWHGDMLEKVTLTFENRTAYQLTLLDDYSRAYVFCDLFREVGANMTIRALIAAMRFHQTIPKALVFDNCSCFKGEMLTAFCRRLGTRLIHSSVNHPQTNGKLERAFRDDMNEFYRRFDKWKFYDLRQKLPAYVEYRNQIRGHYALQGNPAVTRLKEQDFFALPQVLKNLESYAWCHRGQRTVGSNGVLSINSRMVYIHPRLSGQKIRLYETLEGLETEDSAGRFYLLKNYRKEICPPLWQMDDKTRVYYFTRIYWSRRAEFPVVMSNGKEEIGRIENRFSGN